VRSRWFWPFFALVFALAVFAVYRQRQGHKPPAPAAPAGEDDLAWLEGTWRKLPGQGSDKVADHLLFKRPGTAAVMGEDKPVRGTFLVRGHRVSVMAAFRDGSVGESALDADEPRTTLTYTDPKTRRATVFERTSPKSALDEPEGGERPKPEPAAAVNPHDDAAWLYGTWQRQSGKAEWLLFNPPTAVLQISGKPAAVTARGEFVLHGRFVSLVFPQPNGSTAERELKASADHFELTERGLPPATYKRGAPP
jgi:hypothetical protein